eukprot:m.315369 g.315369  ORF g.315369 m.315369 type:complete len:276 (+) comp15973_c0_seq39:5684-6511(+)
MLSGQMPPLQRCIMTSSRATFSPQTHGREALVCSVISDVHNCQMSSWTRKQKDVIQRCATKTATQTDLDTGMKLCQSAETIILKTIRFRGEFARLPKFSSQLKIVHLLRHPFKVARSRFVAGWHFHLKSSPDDLQLVQSSAPFNVWPAELQRLASVFLYVLNFVCRQMLETHHVLQSVTHHDVLEIKYESLLAEPSEVLSQLTTFINNGKPLPASSISRVVDRMSDKLMQLPTSTSFKKLVDCVSPFEWLALAGTHCRRMGTLGYKANPESKTFR